MYLSTSLADKLDEELDDGLSARIVRAIDQPVTEPSKLYVTRLSPDEAKFLEERASALAAYAKSLYGKDVDITPERVLRLLVLKMKEEARWE